MLSQLNRRQTFSLIAAEICGVCSRAKAAPQSAPSNRPAFEVASVRRDEDGHTFGILISGSSVRIGGTVDRLIMEAYGVMHYQILEGPEWARSVESNDYVIVAKVEGDAEPKRALVKQMLGTLLGDRFQLRLHRETQQRQILALVVGKDGLKVKESAPETTTSMRLGIGQVTWLNGTKLPISYLATTLSVRMQQPVVDKTELKGLYDYALRWTPEESAVPVDSSSNHAPSIYAALQEQLGLKLVSQKTDMEVLVIDHVEKPAEN